MPELADQASSTWIAQLGETYLHKWQARLHVADWDLRIQVDQVSEDFGAESRYQWRARRGSICLPPDVVSRHREAEDFSKFLTDEQVVEEAVLHELLHILEAPLSEQVVEELRRLIGDEGSAHDMLRAALRDWREHWINQCVRILLEADHNAGWPHTQAPESRPSSDGSGV